MEFNPSKTNQELKKEDFIDLIWNGKLFYLKKYVDGISVHLYHHNELIYSFQIYDMDIAHKDNRLELI